MPGINRHLIFSLLLAIALPAGASPGERPRVNPCPGPIDSETDPAPVNGDLLVANVRELTTGDKTPAMNFTPETEKELKEAVDPNLVKTKMEQFYRLLYVIQAHARPSPGKIVVFDPLGVRKILATAGVFTDPAVPDQIVSVSVDRTKEEDPRYTVRFGTDSLKVPLNKGKGFYAWENGRCQFNESLLFYKEFAFSLRVRPNGNLIARYFSGVDLYGDFGTRGAFNIDLNYVGLRSVEFFKGKKLGKVVAFVSDQEFKKNPHNPLLRIVTKFVGNTSIQPIDW
jgi:hypothetical protein